ncbi:hypothetical protein CCACVL1_14603 [Corchorus capsularis]|uniref:Uncharacterized protein n=1 Tax=Corchorus capsularis TaxID=210143 RepID=A0A1R3I6I3_COCAP|nr:hypothetical protein CCACVL1_14603 [Corchorus capsularis]
MEGAAYLVVTAVEKTLDGR